ncbi:MAG: hypothetical protein IPP90_00340 [Gemmatimonadaceae bacterium]|nr:hypothetical protein [Gemmatimonadaceae bacterium]
MIRLASSRAAAQCGFDAAPFLTVEQLRRGGTVADRDVEPVLAAYVGGADVLVTYLDRYAPSPDAGGTAS